MHTGHPRETRNNHAGFLQPNQSPIFGTKRKGKEMTGQRDWKRENTKRSDAKTEQRKRQKRHISKNDTQIAMELG
jgi:hypothetical protein